MKSASRGKIPQTGTLMNNNETTNKPAKACEGKAEVMAVGVDVHSNRYVLRHQLDGSQPKPALGMSPEAFRQWIAGCKSKARRVVCCYEAGPFGFHLARYLEKIGVECLVVAPENLDSRNKRVKSDKVDALQLLRRLHSYLSGNTESFTVVRVPGEGEERERCQGRAREQLKGTRQRVQKQGKSLLLSQGVRVDSTWWKPGPWDVLKEDLEQWIVDILEALRQVIVAADIQEKQLKEKLCAEEMPSWDFCGLGELTHSLIRREICSWERFENRRQVGGYTGLCPGIHMSNGRGRTGSVNKHGNPRLRWLLVELAWRVVRYQPDYWMVRKLQNRLNESKVRRKQAVTALARQLAVDMWRLATGQTTLEKLGLRPA